MVSPTPTSQSLSDSACKDASPSHISDFCISHQVQGEDSTEGSSRPLPGARIEGGRVALHSTALIASTQQDINVQIINEDNAIKRNKCLAVLSFYTMESAISAMKKLNGKYLKASKIELNPKNFELPDETVDPPPKPKAAASPSLGPAKENEKATGSKESGKGASASPAAAPVQAFPQPKVSGRQLKKVKSDDSKVIEVKPGMTIKELAETMGIRVVDALKSLIKMGEEPKTIQDELTIDIAELLVLEYGMHVKLPEGTESMVLGRTFTNEEYQKLELRAPVVTIMGHVDHGKTTLLDYLRSTSVAAGEVGGITQSIAAFEVHRPKLGKICFIDTPGHQAFSSMRERGAKATDIIVLVIAAEDGVMPQTIEVIDHARAAQVPIIIAVNKCDLPGADPNMIYSQLMEHGVSVEPFGGDVQTVNISALRGQGIDKLEEAILLLAEMMDLRAPSDGPAEGFIIESRKDKALGPVASVVITLGALHVGDVVVAGADWGRVKVLRDAKGESVKLVGPSSVAEVVGFRSQPSAGQELFVVENDSKAESYTEKFGSRKGSVKRIQSSKQEEHGGELMEVPVIVKADCEGTLEAVMASLLALPSHEIVLKIIESGTGPVTESDVQSASASGAHIYTFNCRQPSAQLKKTIQNLEVKVSDFRIIYDLIDNVTSLLVSKLPPREELQVVGEATVLQRFEITGKNATVVAGSKVTRGMVKSKCDVKVMRKGEVIHEGKVETLRRGKETADQIIAGTECGITLESFTEFEKGDKIQFFEMVVTERTEL